MNTERKRFYSAFLPLFALFMVPIVAVMIFSCLPAVYDGTFLGELSEKYELLEGDGQKTVVIGGSSVAFGLDSEMMEKELGRRTVNFGLYANLGTKMMMDLAKENINSGDIIVIAPELNAQTFSLYFNGETAVQALDGSPGMIKNIPSKDREALIGAMWGFSGQKLRYSLSASRPENSGAYKKENFNEYGDNVYDRPYNVMTGFGNAVDLSFKDSPEFDEYIDYLNKFTAYAEKRGAAVYFSFPPVNEAAILPFNTHEQILDFYLTLQDRLDCEIISDIFNYIMDEGYFYDSEFHLNNSGVTVRTVKLIDDIKRTLGDSTVTQSDLPLPSGRRPDCDDFDLVMLSNRAWGVKSVTETGKNKEALYIPDEVSGIPVTEILYGAFDGADGVSILTLGGNISVIEAGGIKNAAAMSAVILPDGLAAESISLPADIGSGCADGFAVYVPPELYDGYAAYDMLKDIIMPNESFIYEDYGDGLAIVSLSTAGKMRTELEIPGERGGKKILKICAGAVSKEDRLTRLVLGQNVLEIESGAFEGSGGLELVLAKNTDASRLELPENPGDLGEDVEIYAYWEDYYDLRGELKGYEDVIKTDNPYLILELSGDGWTVVGTNDEGKKQTELKIPDSVWGLPVRTVAEGAFSGSSAEIIDIGGSVTRLDGGALAGSAAKTLYIPDGREPGDVSVPNRMSEKLATDGCSKDLKISVDPVLYESYAGDYFWGDYGDLLESRE